MSGLVFVIRRVSRLCILVAVRVWNVTRISSDSEFLARMFNTQWNSRRDMQHLQNQNQTRLPQVWIWNELRASRLESYVWNYFISMASRLFFWCRVSFSYQPRLEFMCQSRAVLILNGLRLGICWRMSVICYLRGVASCMSRLVFYRRSCLSSVDAWRLNCSKACWFAKQTRQSNLTLNLNPKP